MVGNRDRAGRESDGSADERTAAAVKPENRLGLFGIWLLAVLGLGLAIGIGISLAGFIGDHKGDIALTVALLAGITAAGFGVYPYPRQAAAISRAAVLIVVAWLLWNARTERQRAANSRAIQVQMGHEAEAERARRRALGL